MKVQVIRHDKSSYVADLNDRQARLVSQEVAVAVVMTVAETPSGLHDVYVDGNCRQYDPCTCKLV